MKTSLLIIGCLFLSPFALAESYQHQARPIIPQVNLGDGRTLHTAQILSDTAYTVSISHDGRVERIDKKLLPPELLKQWPVDEARGAAENKAAADQEKLNVAHAAEFKAKQEEIKKQHIAEALAQAKINDELYDAQRRKSEAARPAYLKAEEEARLALMARSHDGLFIVGWEALNQESKQGEVKIRNVSKTSVKVEARALRAIVMQTGEEIEVSEIRFYHDEAADLWLSPGEERQFHLIFSDARMLAALYWAGSTELRLPGFPLAKIAESKEQAMALAKAELLAERQARKARILRPGITQNP